MHTFIFKNPLPSTLSARSAYCSPVASMSKLHGHKLCKGLEAAHQLHLQAKARICSSGALLLRQGRLKRCSFEEPTEILYCSALRAYRHKYIDMYMLYTLCHMSITHTHKFKSIHLHKQISQLGGPNQALCREVRG